MLKTESLQLVLLGSHHADALHELIQSNVQTFQAFLPVTVSSTATRELSQQFVEKKIENAVNKNEYLYLVKELQFNDIIGFVYLKNVSYRNKQGEFAYGLAAKSVGKGYMTQAIKLLSTYAFDDLGLDTLQIIAHKTNLKSIQVAFNAGFSWVKTLEDEFTNASGESMNMELYELCK
ncbi:ribosomal-protein-amino-adic N-acetyltransferase [Polaribacter pacificus]|uniref:Ribosomal-protein-amino-adic N-acetyltransferase n=1 Tax=Polaribacter pacificus TaxID=1775173 RepID=A0A917I124_9FLAO|nr:GNAT family N-acetyltransferase [Polaribacter pacificus]GGH00926.1 ribosomal-protein-amino-adic N-acetyltransferase [Polaribacter pacificus]